MPSKSKVLDDIKRIYRPIDDNEPVDADKIFQDMYNCFTNVELSRFLEFLREEYETNIDEDSEITDVLFEDDEDYEDELNF